VTWVLCATLGLIRSTLPQAIKLTVKMELLFYPKLGTFSRRALLRRTQQLNSYTPRRPLLARLSRETGLTMGQIWVQLEKEREYLLNQNALQ
jgi:hypothetical protein